MAVKNKIAFNFTDGYDDNFSVSFNNPITPVVDADVADAGQKLAQVIDEHAYTGAILTTTTTTEVGRPD